MGRIGRQYGAPYVGPDMLADDSEVAMIEKHTCVKTIIYIYIIIHIVIVS